MSSIKGSLKGQPEVYLTYYNIYAKHMLTFVAQTRVYTLNLHLLGTEGTLPARACMHMRAMHCTSSSRFSTTGKMSVGKLLVLLVQALRFALTRPVTLQASPKNCSYDIWDVMDRVRKLLKLDDSTANSSS